VALPPNNAAVNFAYNSCTHPFLDREFTEYSRETDQEICIRRDGKRHGQLRHLTSLVRYPALRTHAVSKTEGEAASGAACTQHKWEHKLEDQLVLISKI
jgi:hypothetical protein